MGVRRESWLGVKFVAALGSAYNREIRRWAISSSEEIVVPYRFLHAATFVAPALALLTLSAASPSAVAQQAAPDAGYLRVAANPEEDKAKKEDAKKEDADDKAAGETVERPDEPPRTPDPRELQVKPDAHGRVPFNFHGQPWPDVLQWLANISGYSLDWQTLPDGYLNLTTQRSYTLPEARDLINRHLQARGYVLLLSGEVLSVVKLDEVDPSLVPTVKELDLYDRQPHDLVKVAFEVPSSIEVAKAVEDFKQALNKHGKLIPLPATGRVLAIGTVANLRLLSGLLNQERLAEEGKEIPRRFVLEHARAEKVINTLYVVLGMDPLSQPSQMELQIQMKKMELLKDMQQKGKDVARMLSKDGPKVFLAFNRLENSILANAPPEQMRIIERTIEFLDIPPAGSTPDDSSNGRRFAKTYELENVQPESLLLTLEEIGDLDPLSELRADPQAKLLFVRATEADHQKVQDIITQLDDGGVLFEVFQLRTLPADGVANTVMALLGEEEEDDDSNDRYSYYFYGRSRGGNDDKKPEFRVDADVAHNRLLVRGTQENIDQVRDLLRQMGELGGPGVDKGPTMRVIDSLGPEQSRRLIEQLRAAWPALGGEAELLIQTPDEAPATEAKEEQPPAETTKSAARRTGRFQLAVDATPTASEDPPADNEPPTEEGSPSAKDAGAPSPRAKVSVTMTDDGRLVLASDDPQAVARAEDLLSRLAPREEQFHEFKIEHVPANYIWYDLRDYFEDELAEERDSGDRGFYYYYFNRGEEQQEVSPSLAMRRKLRFLYIIQTNSVIVANATPSQLATIQRLIEIWDQPPRETDIRQRRTGMVKVQYSSATKIAAALKEVYRDLLSSRDKEFETEDSRGGSGYTTAKTTEVEFAGLGGNPDTASKTSPIRVRFDGALSIGVDEVSNILLVSAQTDIYDGVVSMIRLLDDEARPDGTVQVMRVSAPAAENIQDALSDTFGQAWLGGRPETPGAQAQGGRRDDRRGRREWRERRRRGRDR